MYSKTPLYLTFINTINSKGKMRSHCRHSQKKNTSPAASEQQWAEGFLRRKGFVTISKRQPNSTIHGEPCYNPITSADNSNHPITRFDIATI
jgi:hypothetical protein